MRACSHPPVHHLDDYSIHSNTDECSDAPPEGGRPRGAGAIIVLRLNPVTGQLTAVGNPIAAGTAPTGIAATPRLVKEGG